MIMTCNGSVVVDLVLEGSTGTKRTVLLSLLTYLPKRSLESKLNVLSIVIKSLLWKSYGLGCTKLRDHNEKRLQLPYAGLK
jgi:hypothetical protein